MSRWTIHSTYTQRTITQLREAILPHMTTWTALKDICCCCSVAKWCPTLWPHGLEHTRLPCPSLSPGVCSDSSIELVMLFNHLILCRPLLLLPSIFPSIRVFSNESGLHIRWPKYWSFSCSISPSNEHSGFISFRSDWFDLLPVQRTLRSLLQHHSWQASLLWHFALYPGGNTWWLSQRPLWGDCASERKGSFRRCRVPGVDFNPLILYDGDTY